MSEKRLPVSDDLLANFVPRQVDDGIEERESELVESRAGSEDGGEMGSRGSIDEEDAEDHAKDIGV